MTPGQKAITLPGRVETVTDGGEGTFINALGVFPLPRSEATGCDSLFVKSRVKQLGQPPLHSAGAKPAVRSPRRLQKAEPRRAPRTHTPRVSLRPRWTRGLLLPLGSCERCCCGRGCAHIFSSLCFQLFKGYTQKWDCRVTWQFCSVLCGPSAMLSGVAAAVYMVACWRALKMPQRPEEGPGMLWRSPAKTEPPSGSALTGAPCSVTLTGRGRKVRAGGKERARIPPGQEGSRWRAGS